MLWLAAHMWILLFTAFLIGVGIGWWIFGGTKEGPPPLSVEDELGSLDSDVEPQDNES